MWWWCLQSIRHGFRAAVTGLSMLIWSHHCYDCIVDWLALLNHTRLPWQPPWTMENCLHPHSFVKRKWGFMLLHALHPQPLGWAEKTKKCQYWWVFWLFCVVHLTVSLWWYLLRMGRMCFAHVPAQMFSAGVQSLPSYRLVCCRPTVTCHSITCPFLPCCLDEDWTLRATGVHQHKTVSETKSCLWFCENKWAQQNWSFATKISLAYLASVKSMLQHWLTWLVFKRGTSSDDKVGGVHQSTTHMPAYILSLPSATSTERYGQLLWPTSIYCKQTSKSNRGCRNACFIPFPW